MLRRVLFELAIVVLVLLVVASVVCIGRERAIRTRREARSRLRETAPITAILVSILLFNSVARQIVPDLSWIFGWEATWAIYDIEGKFITWIQSFEHPLLTDYFSFVYIFGYVFMLVFPVMAYFALSNTRTLRELLTAYTLNYTLGLVCYVLIIAYGPRNMIPEVATGLLYDAYPRFQHLTGQVNRNTNVFPSLHTSLAATVAFFAYRTREEYPLWYVVAVVLAVSVAISTMYLGIHWAIDVVAGAVLAYLSVYLATVLVGRWSLSDLLDDRFGDRVPFPRRE